MNIAIVGCGQLAMMMAQAAIKLGFTVSFIAELNEQTNSVTGLGKIARYSPGMSIATLYQEAGMPSVITVEREQVDINLLKALGEHCAVYPSPEAIEVTQNRIFEKNLLQSFNIPVAPFAQVNNSRDLQDVHKTIAPPFFIKHPTSGYDGKSQWRIHSIEELQDFANTQQDFPLTVERKIQFIYEASIIGVRSTTGETSYYPATVNEHKDGILLKSSATNDPTIQQQVMPAQNILEQLFKHWNYVGVLSLELFVTQSGLLVNELAPRVHNSGHWTMDGCTCSQFENHIRAITGLKLGDTKAHENAGMVNLLGIGNVPQELIGDNKIYWYQKETKPRRKMGHINLLNQDAQKLAQEQDRLIAQLYANQPL